MEYLLQHYQYLFTQFWKLIGKHSFLSSDQIEMLIKSIIY